MNFKIYHNPRCSKSRQTLEFLQNNGIDPEIIEYLNNPPSARELKNILESLELRLRELMRKNEELYKTNNLNSPDLSDDQLIRAMIENPILIERPIVLADGKAAIGRPPETVLNIL